MIAHLVFVILALVSIAIFSWKLSSIVKQIKLGRPTNRTDRVGERIKTMLLVAFGQKKMFNRPIPAILHFIFYVAFIITQIELIEVFIDGFTGSHRFFYHAGLGSFYTFVISSIEVLSVLTFIATLIFFARRNLIKIPRFTSSDLNGWARNDANLILLFELLLIIFIFMMNSADEADKIMHSNVGYGFAVSQYLGPLFFGRITNMELLHIFSSIGWWGHLVMVFVFLNYLPYSKHLHILFAFPNTYFSNLNAKGKFNNMESVEAEVKLMLDPSADPYAAAPATEAPQRFGAKDVQDLSWKQLLDAYSCTECGRCTSACPANQTGKLLSPRKIMMDTRDRLSEIGANNFELNDGKSLLGDYITPEELWACTSCNACVQECPVNIDPLSIIVDLRRYLVMEESKVPTELTGMLTNIENNGAPWQFSPADRMKWTEEN
ncbi:MAG: (Fe-S)-binding protein [Crocinitomicaceae bacterium]|nr:(Fe-S)-binding protein [Crocinitomicaceae bacterium]